MGFLPFSATNGEKLFVAIALLIAICFLWLRFIEPHYPLSAWGALVTGTIIGIIIYKYG
ncbi:MAG: hypothetical protein QXR65_07145 [Candidatus Bathyarchaeia archaeon]|nr:hypothetical protein [Candidatus Bathyarchaeota archaeon]